MVPPPSAPPTPTSPFPSPNTQQPSSLSRLTLSDKLLLSQAVHHIGTSPPDWGRVSSILLSHPLIRTKTRLEQASKAGITLGRVFGSRECERAWVALMRQYNLVLQPGEKEVVNESEGESSGSSTLANRAKEARGLPPKTDRGSQLALAQFLYAERIREIQDNIKVKEQKFKSLVADIDALNSGALDAKLSAEVKSLNAQPVTPAVTEPSSRPPPKDRTGGTAPTATTPGASTSRSTRLSRSGSSAALPVDDIDMNEDGTAPSSEANDEKSSAAAEVPSNEDTVMAEGEQTEEIDVEKESESPSKIGAVRDDEGSNKVEADMDASKEMPEETTEEETQAAEVAEPEEAIAVETGEQEEEEEEEEKGTAEEKEEEEERIEATEDAVPEEEAEPTSKQTRSSKRKRASDAGLTAAEQKKVRNLDGLKESTDVGEVAETEEREEIGAKDNKEEDEKLEALEEENDEDGEAGEESRQTRSQPRRSRRAGRGTGVEDDSQPPTPVTPASAVGPIAKNRLGALRSRETSGASGEEEGEGADMDNSRSTIERGSRTSVSPVSVRRGRGTSRLSNAVGGVSRRSRGGSNTSRTEADLSEADKEKAKRKNEKVLMMLLNEVSNHTHGNLFHSAIKEQDAPDYYALVRHPLDIKTIKARIKEGVIVNSTQLRRALNQMFANSLIYNRPGTEIHRMALEMRDAAEEMIDRFEQTQLSASYARR